MTADDVTDTLELALGADLDQVDADQRPRLLSDSGSADVASDLAAWLDKRDMGHVRGAPYHPMAQGKIKRWHQALKNRILLEQYYLPGDLEARIDDFGAADDNDKDQDHQRSARCVRRDGIDQLRNKENLQTEEQNHAELQPLFRLPQQETKSLFSDPGELEGFYFLKLRIN